MNQHWTAGMPPMQMDLWSDKDPSDNVLSVSQLTAQIKALLERQFASVWVSGELSDLARPRSGHIYLTLKDELAQIRGVIWRSTAERLSFDLEDGMQVCCQGQLDLYPPRGSYQLVIRQLEPRGVGALERALRQLQQRLAAEGLFDPAQKKPLPRFPRRIALVTSPTGAAVRDFLEVIRRRWPGGQVLLLPTKVQGPGASQQICRALATANRWQDQLDVIVLTRGGGSLEDLWCFNEEPVVRAIHASKLPVVSAVGHEIDVTLSDLVADVRALTPSEAAERVVPDIEEVRRQLASALERMRQALRSSVAAGRTRLDALAAHRVLRRPYDWLFDLSRRLDELDGQAQRAVWRRHRDARQRVQALADRLESLSPLAVLSRGYSLTWTGDDQQLLTDLDQISIGQQLTTRLARGTLVSRLEQKRSEDAS